MTWEPQYDWRRACNLWHYSTWNLNSAFALRGTGNVQTTQTSVFLFVVILATSRCVLRRSQKQSWRASAGSLANETSTRCSDMVACLASRSFSDNTDESGVCPKGLRALAWTALPINSINSRTACCANICVDVRENEKERERETRSSSFQFDLRPIFSMSDV